MSKHNIDWYKVGADILGSLESVEGVLAERGIDPGLHHLMLLRASQINKCPFCVKMHSRDARKAGESDKRLDHLVVWRHVNDFTDKEKAAFAWVEALTELDPDQDLTPLKAELKEHFSDSEIAALTGIVAMINLWNRIQISNH